MSWDGMRIVAIVTKDRTIEEYKVAELEQIEVKFKIGKLTPELDLRRGSIDNGRNG